MSATSARKLCVIHEAKRVLRCFIERKAPSWQPQSEPHRSPFSAGHFLHALIPPLLGGHLLELMAPRVFAAAPALVFVLLVAASR